MASLRVGIIAEVPPPYGGASVFALRLCANLLEMGHHPTLLSDAGAREHPGLNSVRLRPFLSLPERLHDARIDVVHDTTLLAYWKSANLPALALRSRALHAVPWLASSGWGQLPGEWARASHLSRLRLRVILALPDLLALKGEALMKWGRRVVPGRELAMMRSLLLIREASSPLPPDVQAHFEKYPDVVIVTAWGFQAVYDLRTTFKALRAVAAKIPSVGVILAGSNTCTVDDKGAMERILDETGLREHTLVVMDVAWLVGAIARARALVRGNVVEGDSNSISEALQLDCVPVVADNGDRPPGSSTFLPGNVESLTAALVNAVRRDRSVPIGNEVRKRAQDNLAGIVHAYERTRDIFMARNGSGAARATVPRS